MHEFSEIFLLSICDSHLPHTSVTSLNLLGNGWPSLKSWLNLLNGLKVFLHMFFFPSTSLLIVLNTAHLVYPHGQHKTQSRYSFWPSFVKDLGREKCKFLSLSLPLCLYFWLSIIVFIIWPYNYLTREWINKNFCVNDFYHFIPLRKLQEKEKKNPPSINMCKMI